MGASNTDSKTLIGLAGLDEEQVVPRVYEEAGHTGSGVAKSETRGVSAGTGCSSFQEISGSRCVLPPSPAQKHPVPEGQAQSAQRKIGVATCPTVPVVGPLPLPPPATSSGSLQTGED